MISSFRQKLQASTDWGTPDPTETFGAHPAEVRKRRSAAKAPITAHRLFPAFGALWFAALLGLGSLAISSEVLGVLVTKLGLPALVPAAAPPLGLTARLLVALVLAAIGGALGLALGLRLHRPATPAPRADEAQPPFASAASAEAGFAKAALTPAADLPKVRARDAHPDAPPRRPLVLTEAFAEPAGPLIDEIEFPAIPASPLSRGEPDPAPLADPAVQGSTWLPADASLGATSAKPLDLGVLDLAALDLAEAKEAPEPVQASEPAPALAPAAEPSPPPLLAATPQVPSGFTLARPSFDQIRAGEPWSPVASTPLASLGLVQMIERLALAIAARKAARDAGPPPPEGTAAEAEPEVAPESHAESHAESRDEFGAESGVEAAAQSPAPFAKPASKAATGGDLSPGASLGFVREAIARRLHASALPSAPTAGPGPFSRPLQTDHVVPFHREECGTASEETPVPAPAATSAPATTEESLRSALATLRQITAHG